MSFPLSFIRTRSVRTVTLALFCLAAISIDAASASQWRKYRANARAASAANDFNTSLQQYQLAFREAEAAFKGTDLRFLDTVGEAGDAFVRLRRYDEAIEMYKSALERLQKPKGGEQSYRSAFLLQLGSAYLYARKLDLAEESFTAAEKFTIEKLGERHLFVAEALEGLGSIYIQRNQPEEALPILKRALDIATSGGGHSFFNGLETQFRRGPSSTEHSIQNTIGLVYLTQSNYVEAEKAFREAVKTINRQPIEMGGRSSLKANTAGLHRNLALAYRGQGRYTEAEDSVIRSVVIGENLEGFAVLLGQSINLLASIQYEQNDARLDRLFARMLTGKSTEPDPKNFVPYVEVMARYYASRDWKRAVALLEKAQVAGPDQAAEVRSFGARLAVEQKQPDSAREILTKSIAELRTDEGAEAALVNPLKQLAELEVAQGNFEAAEIAFKEFVSACRSAFGTDSRTANAMDDYASFLEKQNRNEEASAKRTEANQIRTDALKR